MHKLRKTVPVGINPVPVWLSSLAGLMLSILICVWTFRDSFAMELNAISRYNYETGERTFRSGLLMAPYKILDAGFDVFKLYFLFALIFCVFFIAYHYMGSKSMFTMRRLKNPCELYVRCFTVTAVSIAVGIITVYILNYFYIKYYLSVIPGEHLSSLWDENAWRVWL